MPPVREETLMARPRKAERCPASTTVKRLESWHTHRCERKHGHKGPHSAGAVRWEQ